MSTPPPEQAGPSRWARWVIVLVLVLVVASFYLLGLQRYFSLDFVLKHAGAWKEQVQEHLLFAALLLFGLYVAVTSLSLPVATPLSLAAGYLFGLAIGIPLVAVAAALGATCAFLASRYLLRSMIQQRFGSRLEVINRGIEREGIYYLFTLRLVPYVPFWLINLGMGLTRMRVWTFMWVTFLGILPGTVIYVNAGQKLGEIKKAADIVSLPILLSLALLGLLPLLLKKLLPRPREESTS